LKLKGREVIECAMLIDKELQTGLSWGKPRRGHPEGAVKFHVKEIWDLINQGSYTIHETRLLRILALLHDSFKYKVDTTQPKTRENHHGWFARQFAAKHHVHLNAEFSNTEIAEILEMLQWHDEPYNIHRNLERKPKRALERLEKLLSKSIRNWWLFLEFLKIDGSTGDKNNKSNAWFEDVLKSRSLLQ